jgi:hypothetical protein
MTIRCTTPRPKSGPTARCGRRPSSGTEIGPGSRIAARADRALKLSNAFAVQPAVPSFVPSNLLARRSRSRRRICGRKKGAEPGVPRSPGLRNRNSTGARAHAARYVVDSTLHGQVRFEPAQLRVAAAAPFRSSSRSRQRSSIFARMRVSRSSADAVATLARCSIPISLLGADLLPHAMREISLRTQSSFTARSGRRARPRTSGSAWRR